MKNFNTKRFANLLVFSFSEERGFFVKLMVGVSLFMAFMLFSFGVSGSAPVSGSDSMPGFGAAMLQPVYNMAVFLLIIFYIFLLQIGGSLLMRNMKTKRQRIAYIMLPASSMEKFLSRLLLVVGGGTLVMVVSVVFADVVQMLFVKLFTDAAPRSFLPVIFRTIGLLLSEGFSMSGSMTVDSPFLLGFWYGMDAGMMNYPDIARGTMLLPWMFLEFLFDFSIFVFCGTLFRRLSWAWAILASCLKTFALGCVPESLSWMIPVVYVVGAVVLLIEAYRLFCRSQVITRKNLNL